MSNILLSFCIPTYNRSDGVVDLVQRILSGGSDRIEVAVLDNCSTDDTLARLRSIKDPRLVFHSNERNLGSRYNAMKVLNMARGKFIVLVLDKDGVNPEKLAAFERHLSESEDVACGYCEFNSAESGRVEHLKKGFAALRRIAYGGRHPSGIFFRRKYFQEIDILHRYTDPEKEGAFALDLMLGEMSMKGDGVVFHDPVFTPEAPTLAARHKSYNIDGNSKNAFYSPQQRLRMAVNYLQHLQSLSLPLADERQLVGDIFMRGIALATAGYRALLANPDLCAHYRLQPRKFGAWEMFRTGLWFYAAFQLAMWRSLRWSVLQKLSLQVILMQRIAGKGMRKAAL